MSMLCTFCAFKLYIAISTENMYVKTCFTTVFINNQQLLVSYELNFMNIKFKHSGSQLI